MSSRGASLVVARVRVGNAFAQLVMSGLRSGDSGCISGVVTSGIDDWTEEGVVEIEDEEDAEGCRRELSISVERESRAGCRYPSNHRLKQES
jgi:hypothetical protein